MFFSCSKQTFFTALILCLVFCGCTQSHPASVPTATSGTTGQTDCTIPKKLTCDGYKVKLQFFNIQSFVQRARTNSPCLNYQEIARYILNELGYHREIVKGMSKEALTEVLTYESVDIEELYLPVGEYGVVRLTKRIIKTVDEGLLLISVESKWMTEPSVEAVRQLKITSDTNINEEYHAFGFLYYEGNCTGESDLPDFNHQKQWNKCVQLIPSVDTNKVSLIMELLNEGECQYYKEPAVSKNMFQSHTVDWKQIIGYVQFQLDSPEGEVLLELL